MIQSTCRDILALGMESDLQNDTQPTGFAKKIAIACVAVVLIGLSVLLLGRDSSLPMTASFVNTVNDYHPPTIPDVPCIAFYPHSSGAIRLDMQLECFSNGTWFAWPPHVADSNALANVQLAKWNETVLPGAQLLTHPRQDPGSITTNLLRVHGFAAREKVGLAALPYRIELWVKEYSQNHFQKPTNTTVLPSTALAPGATPPPGWKRVSGGWVIATPGPAQKIRFFSGGTEFFTSPFCITNESMELKVSRSQ